MTQSLAQTLTFLISDLLDSAHTTPVSVEHIGVTLPMEFDLRHAPDGLQIAMTPPDALQSRGLAAPLGRLNVALDITDGGSDG